ncbi:hypothetical protein [Melittangium boletus]|uniref:hypothetical protein n=1 Tax=Melittangium boletus TaxID=83453 RepID=UPI003DA47717
MKPARPVGLTVGVLLAITLMAGRQDARHVARAALGVVLDVSGSTRRIAVELSRLKASKPVVVGHASGLLAPYLHHAERQRRWLEGELAGASHQVRLASAVEDPDMELALLRLAGPRLEAALLGSLLLAAWLDFLNLADVVLQQCPFYSAEHLLVDLERLRGMVTPPLTALASREAGQFEAAAVTCPRSWDSSRASSRRPDAPSARRRRGAGRSSPWRKAWSCSRCSRR